jgi:formylglycine-generating enzyme
MTLSHWPRNVLAGACLVLATAGAVSAAEPLPPLMRIPAGDFIMGSDAGAPDEHPAHKVAVAEFLIGVHEVTQAEYARFVAATSHRLPGSQPVPSIVAPERLASFREIAANYAWENGKPPAGKENHPVVLVGIDDALAYCAWLGKETGQEVRLPSEAEWEKAARGGLVGARYPWGNEELGGRANYLPDVKLKPSRGTEPVGKYAANGYSLFDMSGNAWEWVADVYAPYPGGKFPEGAPTDNRLVRGGAWLDDNPDLLTVSHRHETPPDTFSYSIGFRVAVSAAKK